MSANYSNKNSLVYPSGTTAARPTSVNNGFLYFNTTVGALQIYQNGSWYVLTNITAPGTPTGVTATNQGTGRAYNNGQASVAFVPASDTFGFPATFTVTSSPGSFTASGTSSPLTITGLQSNTSYTYTVTASNNTGTSSASSASAGVTATTVPQAPTIGTPTNNTATSINVVFTPGQTGGSSITTYTATPYISGVIQTGLITSGGSSPITVTGLTAGTSYTFTVTATNANGTSAASAASSSIVANIVPNAPTSVSGTSGDSQVSLTWTAPTSNGGSSITDYTIQYSSNSGSTWTTFNDSVSTATSATVTGLTNGTGYMFRVAAVNSAGTSSYSANSSTITPNAPSIYTTSNATFRLKMPFNSANGINDLSSNAYSFTNNNCSISSAQSKFYGQSLSVPNTGGVSSSQINRIYGSAPSIWQPILNSTTTFFTSAWVYLTATPDTWGTYLWGADVGGVANGCFLAFNPNKSISVGWQDNVNSAANAVSLNTWTHILWSFNASGKVHKLYINGTAVATVNNQNIYYANSQDKFHVGIRDNNINVSQIGFYIQDLVIMTGASIDNNFTVPGALV